jgi:histidinol-phosphate aminotransferase
MNYRFDNVITLRTFSKAYGLASARVGYGFAHENLISMLLKVKLPFEPSGVSAAAALGALDDYEFVQKTVENNAQGLAYLNREFREMGFEVMPSAANFVTVILETEDQAQQLFERLLQRGVIVRPLKATGLPSCLRISVGTKDENEMCVETLKSVRAELELAELETGSYATTH